MEEQRRVQNLHFLRKQAAKLELLLERGRQLTDLQFISRARIALSDLKAKNQKLCYSPMAIHSSLLQISSQIESRLLTFRPPLKLVPARVEPQPAPLVSASKHSTREENEPENVSKSVVFSNKSLEQSPGAKQAVKPLKGVSTELKIHQNLQLIITPQPRESRQVQTEPCYTSQSTSQTELKNQSVGLETDEVVCQSCVGLQEGALSLQRQLQECSRLLCESQSSVSLERSLWAQQKHGLLDKLAYAQQVIQQLAGNQRAASQAIQQLSKDLRLERNKRLQLQQQQGRMLQSAASRAAELQRYAEALQSKCLTLVENDMHLRRRCTQLQEARCQDQRRVEESEWLKGEQLRQENERLRQLTDSMAAQCRSLLEEKGLVEQRLGERVGQQFSWSQQNLIRAQYLLKQSL